MKQKLQWAMVIFTAMVLGGSVVVGVDSLTNDGNGGGSTIIERVSDSGSPVAQTAPSDVADLYEQIRPSVVRVGVGDVNSNPEGLGSGVVIDKQGHILTNNH